MERSDYYSMQICQKIDSIFGKGRPLGDYEIPFRGKPELTPEQATILSKMNLGLM